MHQPDCLVHLDSKLLLRFEVDVMVLILFVQIVAHRWHCNLVILVSVFLECYSEDAAKQLPCVEIEVLQSNYYFNLESRLVFRTLDVLRLVDYDKMVF